ncbi:hypothetical protein PPYR_07235 [Photinus pyralis]|uniref:KAP NTPase domain-containing protein n=1 Tax=Photinus pyralis TaxID=7054 RepID=A0A1Y1MQN3_PHOPY|nr:protein SMG9 [Photinus pyralis]KAB0799355.1 hypothetical protein PPYR_07235 [Photinus pyralis]
MSDYDRSKFYGKKKFPNRESNNFGSRFFNSKTSTTKESDKVDDKPKSIKKTTILAREHHAEERSVSPKPVIRESDSTPSIAISASLHSESSKQHLAKKIVKCVKLLDDGVICPENVQDYLQENDDYLVVGIVGMQGVGKSTILNLLAHNSISNDLKRSIFKYSEDSKENVPEFDVTVNESDCKIKVDNVIFKPQGAADIASNSNGTSGIDFFITQNRIIFLDCQPFSSVAVLDDFIRSEAKVSSMVNDFLPLENSGEIQGLQMTALLMSICHVLILAQDWFFDSNVIRFLQTAEMLKPTISNPEDELVDHFPHLIIIQNKAQMEDFSPKKFKQMQQMYRTLFNKSKMHLESGMGLGSGRIMNSLSPNNCGDPINLFLIPEYNEKTDEVYKGHPSLEDLVKKLRSNILGATKYHLNNTSEKHWLVYCSKVWDHVKKSNFFVEYTKLMP